MINQGITLILDNIRSRENVGSIFRTADAVGVSKVYLCGITPRPPHPKITKSALGSDEFVKWGYVKQIWRLIDILKKDKYKIVAIEQSPTSKNIFTFKTKFPIAVILGNEVSGISKSILRRCDYVLEIPMRGKKESLNVSVSAGVALYQLIKKWNE